VSAQPALKRRPTLKPSLRDEERASDKLESE
jgi:hypothetical protein